jgi:uncharacterized membrane protein HdeD (DUF308 family)
MSLILSENKLLFIFCLEIISGLMILFPTFVTTEITNTVGLFILILGIINIYILYLNNKYM